MTKFLAACRYATAPQILLPIIAGFAACVIPQAIAAAGVPFYDGPGIVGGLTDAQSVGGVVDRNLRDIILDILLQVLLFMGLAAVVVIVIAGIWLVLSVGDEQAKEKAKKIILYAVIGLIVIAIASGIVLIIINATGTASIFGPVPDLGNTGGSDIRVTVLNILEGVLAFMALAAVVVIVIAGILLVVSLGDEQAKDKAKKIILYAIIGLFVILLASAIVRFIESVVIT